MCMWAHSMCVKVRAQLWELVLSFLQALLSMEHTIRLNDKTFTSGGISLLSS